MFIDSLNKEGCASMFDGRQCRNVEGSNIMEMIDTNANMHF
jgi:hypothetical protein